MNKRINELMNKCINKFEKFKIKEINEIKLDLIEFN